MLIKKPDGVKSSEITNEKLYLARRTFMRGAVLAATTVATGTLYRNLLAPTPKTDAERSADAKSPPPAGPDKANPAGDELTPYEDITNYNNFYEFSTDKSAVARKAKNFVTRPWTIAVEGLVHKPRVYDIDDLLKANPQEERIYRLRCVEGWSMVIPWLGFPLARLLGEVEPMAQAKFVKFETLYDPKRMPMQNESVLRWPYFEGLRLDEALHPLTLLATGLYGREMPAQNGAPLRLVVPWKYGFKSIKSIVSIRLIERQPQTTWNLAAPREYGFYANVNPEVDHPRWSQARERRIGEFWRRPTLPFNGYGESVAHLYQGMNLKVSF